MFDIGFSELLIIAVVALVVLGPERLPKAARFAGLWVRRARAQWYSVKSELERDLAAEELRRSLHDSREAMRGLGDSVRHAGEDIERGYSGVRESVAGRPRHDAPAPGGGEQAGDAGTTATASADAVTDGTSPVQDDAAPAFPASAGSGHAPVPERRDGDA